MVLKRERFNLERIATKNTIQVVRFLTTRPYLSFGLTELSEDLQISKSNVLRILTVLRGYNLIIEQKTGKKKLFRINSEKGILKNFWDMFMSERKYNLPTNLKNVIDLFYEQVNREVELFIIFGSVAHGLATEESDVDIFVVSGKDIAARRFDFLPYRFEIHQYTWGDVKDTIDFVILDALLHGIVYKGDVFEIVSNLKSFPKSYLIYRLEKAKEFMKKAEFLEAEAAAYYSGMATITVHEIDAVLHRKSTIPKRELAGEARVNDVDLKHLEEELAHEGERVWLI